MKMKGFPKIEKVGEARCVPLSVFFSLVYSAHLKPSQRYEPPVIQDAVIVQITVGVVGTRVSAVASEVAGEVDIQSR
jgi:hypothetical protein